MCNYYVLNDGEDKSGGAIPVPKEKLKEYNKRGYGIFWSPNKFKDGKRKAECLEKINFWIADIDDGSKEEQMERIKKLPIEPSTIVETKKGYHCYWRAENATEENYRAIEEGLIKRLNADPHCKDVARILRVPNYYHMKDKAHPFLVQVVYQNYKTYSEDKMLLAYKLPAPKYKKLKYEGDKQDLLDENNWNRIFKLNTIGEGCRNAEFSRIAFWLRDEKFPEDIVLNTILRMNSKISNPLSASEIRTIVRSKF